jgi:hypothetical protein
VSANLNVPGLETMGVVSSRDGDESDLYAAESLVDGAAEAWNSRAVVGDVDRRPRVLRRLHLGEEVVRAEVELVVAGHRDVEWHQIGELYGVGTLSKPDCRDGDSMSPSNT